MFCCSCLAILPSDFRASRNCFFVIFAGFESTYTNNDFIDVTAPTSSLWHDGCSLTEAFTLRSVAAELATAHINMVYTLRFLNCSSWMTKWTEAGLYFSFYIETDSRSDVICWRKDRQNKAPFSNCPSLSTEPMSLILVSSTTDRDCFSRAVLNSYCN